MSWVGFDESVAAGMRSSVANVVLSGAPKLRTASAAALVGMLAASALVPIATVSVGGVAGAGIDVLGSVGANVLTNVLIGAIDKLRPKPAVPGVRDAVADRIELAFRSADSADARLRAEVIALFEAVDVAGSALQAAAAADDTQLLARMVTAFADITTMFGEFGFVLAKTRLEVQALHLDLRREIAQQSADRERSRQTEADIRRLLDLVREHGLGQSERRSGLAADGSPRWNGCPYLGLMAFEERHSTVFYGRRAVTSDLLDRVSEQLLCGGFLLVVGPSGAGKSSLLRAGLLAAISEDRLEPGSRSWQRRALTPTAKPVENLATHLADLCGVDAASVYRALVERPEQAHLLAAQARVRGKPTRLVLVIDQLEELFTLGADRDAQLIFLTALNAIATTPAGLDSAPVAVVVVGMRGDFLDQATAFTPLKRAVEAGVFTVGAMTESELAEAITGPAAEAGVGALDDLTAVILDDLRDRASAVGFDSGVLPLLSQVMFTMWQADDAHRLSVADYRRTGGVAGIVYTCAEAAYSTLDDHGQEICRRIFLQLAVSSDGRLTRHPATRAALRTAADCSDGDLGIVLDAFTDRRLITCADSGIISIAHEELLRCWTRLHDWLQPAVTDQVLHRTLVDDVDDWEGHQRDPSYLYEGGQLHAVQDAVARWSADPTHRLLIGDGARAFLKASWRRSQRRRRTYRAVTAAMAILVATTTGAAILANRSATWAKHGEVLAAANAARADRQRVLALSRGLAAQSRSLSTTSWSTAQRLAAAALRFERTQEAEEAASALLAHYADTIGLRGNVLSMAFNRNGRLMTLTDGDKVQAWDTATGGTVPASSLPGETTLAEFSPDATLMATVNNETLRMLDPMTGQQIWHMPVADNSPSAVVFSPDGKLLAVVDTAALSLWDTATGHRIGMRLPTNGAVTQVAFSPQGTQLATIGFYNTSTMTFDETLRLWDWKTGRQLRGPLTSSADSMAFSADGKFVVTSSYNDNVVKLWDPATGRQTGRPLIGHTGPVLSMAFSPDGERIVTSSLDGTVRLWDPKTRRQIGASLVAHAGISGSEVLFSHDGKVLATAGADNTVRFWDPTTGRQANAPLTGHTGAIDSVAFSLDGEFVAAGGDDETVLLWNPATGHPVGSPLVGHYGPVRVLGFSPDRNRLVAAGDKDKTVRIWTPGASQKAVASPSGHNGIVRAAAFDNHGSSLATASDDRTVKRWNPSTSRATGTTRVGFHGMALPVVFSPDQKLLAGLDQDGVVRLWNAVTGQLAGPRLIDGPTETASPDPNVLDVTRILPLVNAIAFSPDGKLLATEGDNHAVRLWSTASSRAVGIPLTGHTDALKSAAFSRNGDLLATSATDGTVRLWNPATGKQIGIPLAANGSVNAIAWSPNSKSLATAGDDGTVRLWNPALFEDPLHSLCAQAGEITAEEWADYIGGKQDFEVCT